MVAEKYDKPQSRIFNTNLISVKLGKPVTFFCIKWLPWGDLRYFS